MPEHARAGQEQQVENVTLSLNMSTFKKVILKRWVKFLPPQRISGASQHSHKPLKGICQKKVEKNPKLTDLEIPLLKPSSSL